MLDKIKLGFCFVDEDMVEWEVVMFLVLECDFEIFVRYFDFVVEILL